MKLKLRSFRLIGAITLSAFLSSGTTTYAQQTYSFGIVPQSNGTKLSRTWTPILQYLESKTGYKFRFSTARNIPTFEQRLAKGKYDFAYMNPYHYVQYHNMAGYEAFAKAKNKRLKGILVVHKDSPYQTIKDLESKSFAFPSNAFAANQIPRAIFGQMGMSFDAKYVASHDSVYRNVAKGRYPAGGGVMRTFRNTSEEYRKELRILWTSNGYTPHAFAVQPRVPADVVQTVLNAMLQMDQDPMGKRLLKSIRLKGIEIGNNQEWNDVRELNL